MVASIIARSYGDGKQVKLSLRLATPTLKNAIALNVSVDKENWDNINKSLKYYSKAYKRGSDFDVDGGLKSKLWNILKSVDIQHMAGLLTLESAKKIVEKILRQDVIKEMEQLTITSKTKHEEDRVVTLKEWIREFIRQCESGERLKRKSTRKVASSTIKNYKGTLVQIEEYERVSNRKVDFDDMTLDFYEEWRQFFIRKRYSPNTIGRHVKNLKIFLYAAKDMKLTTTSDFESSRFSVDHEDVDNVYLTAERVQEMYAFTPTDRKQLDALIGRAALKERETLRELTEKATSRRRLEEAKDVFVVGCLTGQRVSDYKRMSADMIVELRDGRRYIRIVQEKTDKEVFLPLDERVAVILKKYGGRLPKIADQHLNERIKTVGRLLGWTETAGIKERRGVMEVRSRKKFYECIKTHTARRTFATNAYKDGISLASIMAVTGHSSEMMLRKYLKLDNKERAILAAEEFARMKGVRLKMAE